MEESRMSVKLGACFVLTPFLLACAISLAADPPPSGNKDSSKAAATPATDKAAADPAVTKSGDAELTEVEQQMLEKTNAQRVRYGLPPLRAVRRLIQTARSHAAWMTNNRTLQHTSQPVGENIAMGQPTTDQAVHDWMNSSGHRANILSASYTQTGVAAYRTPDGTIYWCQQFAP
jgi:uncharacterized protein YkwD